MKRQFSAGGIVFNDKNEVLVIQNSLNKHWGFPKGWIDSGEDSKTAALREVKEEGGVEAEIVEKLGETKFVFTQDGEKIFKVVIYFLMKYKSGDPKDHDNEVTESKFVSIDEALKTLTFNSDKQLLKKAAEKASF